MSRCAQPTRLWSGRRRPTRLGALLPDAVRAGMDGYLSGGILTQKERQLLKAADRLSALIKCVEEKRGNREFAGARAQQTAALSAMECPEADYFMQHMLPCYDWTLDDASAGGPQPG